MEQGENGDANLLLANYTHLSVGSSNLSRGIQVVLTVGLILPRKGLHNTTGHFSHVNAGSAFFPLLLHAGENHFFGVFFGCW